MPIPKLIHNPDKAGFSDAENWYPVKSRFYAESISSFSATMAGYWLSPLHLNTTLDGVDGGCRHNKKRILEAATRQMKAFSSVKREDFIGDPPWQMVGDDGPFEMRARDPAVLYQDELFVLKEDFQLNNGRPSVHASGLNALDPQLGETVAHIGAGTGYYTALLAHLVGPAGRVIAVEYDRSLYERAKTALQGYSNVELICGDGRNFPEQEVNCVYVNFAVLNPADPWVEKLADGGRAIIQIGPRYKDAQGTVHGVTQPGATLLIYRAKSEFFVTWLAHTSFIFCQGDVNFEDEERLRAAFQNGGVEYVNRLFWKSKTKDGQFWFSSGPVKWSNV